MPSFTSRNGASWVWRCHIDSSLPDPTVWEFVNGYVTAYDAAVFTMDEFVPPGLTGPRMYTIPPAIDPLSSKNRTLPKYLSRGVVEEFGTDLSRPMILQVSRFDPWKDPVGVIQAYRLVKENLPELQLVLIGSMASDDPEGWAVLDAAKNEAGGDPDIKLFTNLNGVGAHEVNAFQRTADVVVQKSVREGFGLVVSEAVWKGTPVVGGATGGIPLQIQDEVGGYLVNSVEECAEKVRYLLENPEKSSSVAERGRELVRHNFLITRLLRDELRLLRDLKNGPPNSTSLSP